MGFERLASMGAVNVEILAGIQIVIEIEFRIKKKKKKNRRRHSDRTSIKGKKGGIPIGTE